MKQLIISLLVFVSLTGCAQTWTTKVLSEKQRATDARFDLKDKSDDVRNAKITTLQSQVSTLLSADTKLKAADTRLEAADALLKIKIDSSIAQSLRNNKTIDSLKNVIIIKTVVVDTSYSSDFSIVNGIIIFNKATLTKLIKDIIIQQKTSTRTAAKKKKVK